MCAYQILKWIFKVYDFKIPVRSYKLIIGQDLKKNTKTSQDGWQRSYETS